MNVIARLLNGHKRSLNKIDIKHCLRDMEKVNADGLNDKSIMTGMYVVVFEYNIIKNTIRRIMVEKYIRVAIDWINHVNKTTKKRYHAMICFDDSNDCILYAWDIMSMHIGITEMNNFDEFHFKKTGHRLEEYDNDGYLLSECNCALCKEYWNLVLWSNNEDLSKNNKKIAMDLCQCKWCTLQSKTKYVNHLCVKYGLTYLD